ncbi:MAG TPA: hypothetical protein VN668_18105 [Stellaceae bacterium]|nr:hypothetical protein [Stellaceae bacterium]
MPLGSDAIWQEEWQALLRRRDAVLERSRALQHEIREVLRRREALPMDLLRSAERTDGELAALRARLKEFLGRIG